jgi:nucleoside-diphosphate-sugar epimerase
MRALVLGGSVFVGKRLVQALVADGHEVSVLNRGKTPTELPEGVGHLVADRTDIASMRSAVGSSEWDVVYDVSGFVMAAGGSDIDGLLDLFDGRVGDYVYVSSIMAYDQSLTGIFP